MKAQSKNTQKLILVVDDEEDVRSYLFELLSGAGYTVATAGNAHEALRYISTNKPDLAIVDIRMPQVEGIELLTLIRNNSPETRILMISAYGDWPEYIVAREKGAEDLLPKPIKNQDLLDRVANIFEKTANISEGEK